MNIACNLLLYCRIENLDIVFWFVFWSGNWLMVIDLQLHEAQLIESNVALIFKFLQFSFGFLLRSNEKKVKLIEIWNILIKF